MEHHQRNTILTRPGNARLGAYIFPNNGNNNQLSQESHDLAIRKVREADDDAAWTQLHPKDSQQPKGTTTPVIFKVDSATSSLSSPSEAGIIRPPCSKRSQTNKTKSKPKGSGDAEKRNDDENPVMTLQKLMSKRTRRAKESPFRIESEPPQQPQEVQFRGSFADIDLSTSNRRARARHTENETSKLQKGRDTSGRMLKMPPMYHTVIADTRYPQPQDTLDDVFNVLEHAICPNPNVSMKKDALDVFFGAAEKMLCGPDPRYAYQRKRIEPDDDEEDDQEEEREEKHVLLRKAIDEKHVLTKYPRLIAEGAKSKNYDVVVAAAEAASQLTLGAPNVISPPSAKLLQLQEESHREMITPEDLLDVICNHVEAASCKPSNRSAVLSHAQHKRLPKKDVLDLICEGVEHQVCGAATLAASEEEMMITFDDPEEEKRQALQRLFKPPARKKGNQPPHQVSTITPPAMNRKMPAIPQANTIIPPALMRRQAASRRDLRCSQFVEESREETEQALHCVKKSDSRDTKHQRRLGQSSDKKSTDKIKKRTAAKSKRDPPPTNNDEQNIERKSPNTDPEVVVPQDGTNLERGEHWAHMTSSHMVVAVKDDARRRWACAANRWFWQMGSTTTFSRLFMPTATTITLSPALDMTMLSQHICRYALQSTICLLILYLTYHIIVTPTPPSTAAGSGGPTFDLQDYTVPAPVCAITGDDNVQCDFTGIVPATGKLVYSITGFDACEGTATRDSLMSLSATAAAAADGASSVTIDLTTDFNLASGANEAFQFCLLTSLQDGSGNEMVYQGQKISATFVADGDFTVSNIAAEEFDGISGVVADDQKTFGIDAYRCTIDRTPLATAGALAVGTTLFICIDSTDDSAVIDSVNTFVGRKNSEEIDLLSGNTEVLGAGTGAVTIGSRPFASFFANTDPLEIFGTVSLDVTDINGTNRRQLLRVLQSSQSEEFELKVELEAVEESSASTSGFGTTAVALLGAVAAAVL
ncbi:unnamed protein product [Cylindrotheca closterium]|uniref:Uncharacterized protein n=1 Tax=Cylindrotheca closterium TaxID=2856 RepID=A0AAD2JK88_9STRA|nr:unnamed protein product [Cylindrotheca closterium]